MEEVKEEVLVEEPEMVEAIDTEKEIEEIQNSFNEDSIENLIEGGEVENVENI